MKTTFAAATLAAVSGMASADYFTGISSRSASPIHLLPVTASGQRLYLGGNTATYCPENVEQQGGCPAGKYTSFSAVLGSTQDPLYMGASVPGGQQVYVEPCKGAVMYTQAHSVDMPEGSLQTGFALNGAGPNGLGRLDWQQGGFLACNTTAGGPYQIFASLPNVHPDGTCLGFSFLTSHAEGPTAWQYS